jgi:hypothetical protein
VLILKFKNRCGTNKDFSQSSCDHESDFIFAGALHGLFKGTIAPFGSALVFDDGLGALGAIVVTADWASGR